MIEMDIVQYLTDNLGIKVGMEKPTGSDDNFVVLERLGGNEVNKINHGTFALYSFGATLMEAIQTDITVRGLMAQACVDGLFFSFEIEDNRNDSDFELKEYCYRTEFDISYMEV